MRIPLNITGGTYESRAVQLSAQVTRNWYPEVQDGNVNDKYNLMPWFGLSSFSTDGSGSDRGMLFHRDVLYKISGITLYSVNSSGTSTSLGTIQGSKPCVMQGFGDNVLVATGEGKVYQYDGSVAEITDVDLESPTWVAVLKNFAIFGGTGDRFVVSKFNDATDINALDYATAETQPDALVRGYSFGEELYLFGQKTLERWFVSGVGRPPVDFRDSATIGIASRMSVSHNDQNMYWLSDDRKVYRVPGLQPVSNVGLSNAFEGYTTVDDAIGFCCTKQGQNFYHLSFPTEDVTWVFSESAGEWFNLSRNTSTGRDLANSYAYAYGKHLVASYSDHKIYDWDESTYTEDGAEIERERITGVLHGGLLGKPGYRVEVDQFGLNIESGVGNLSETNPKIGLQVSINGGKTFGTERWIPAGKSGEFENKVYWNNCGAGEKIVFKIKAADNAHFSIHSAWMDLNFGS